MTAIKFGDVDQERILNMVSDQLKFMLPPGWDYVQVKYGAVGGYGETAAVVHPVVGALYPWSPPDVIAELFDQLRAVAANPTDGTWFSSVFEMRYPGSFRVKFDKTAEPEFREAPPASAFAEELSRFPRADENVPDWLRQRLDEADGDS